MSFPQKDTRSWAPRQSKAQVRRAVRRVAKILVRLPLDSQGIGPSVNRSKSYDATVANAVAVLFGLIPHGKAFVELSGSMNFSGGADPEAPVLPEGTSLPP